MNPLILRETSSGAAKKPDLFREILCVSKVPFDADAARKKNSRHILLSLQEGFDPGNFASDFKIPVSFSFTGHDAHLPCHAFHKPILVTTWAG